MTATQEPTIVHPSKTRRFFSRWNGYKARCVICTEKLCGLGDLAWIKVKPILARYFTSNAGTGGGFPERDPAVSMQVLVCWKSHPPETGAARAAACDGATKDTAYNNLNSHPKPSKRRNGTSNEKSALTNRTRCYPKAVTAGGAWSARAQSAYASAEREREREDEGERERDAARLRRLAM